MRTRAHERLGSHERNFRKRRERAAANRANRERGVSQSIEMYAHTRVVEEVAFPEGPAGSCAAHNLGRKMCACVFVYMYV